MTAPICPRPPKERPECAAWCEKRGQCNAFIRGPGICVGTAKDRAAQAKGEGL